MRAFYVTAKWDPKTGYEPSQREIATRRSARGHSIWKDMEFGVVDRPLPEPKENEVLIRVLAAGICGTDAHLLKHDESGYTLYDGHSKYPIITGHEFAGEVVATGAKVHRLKSGDLVSIESMNWCGECDACRMGMFNQCQMLEEPGLTFDGGFAEFAAVKEKYCYKLNDILDYYNGDKMAAIEMGAMVEPLGVAYNGIFVRGGGFRPGGHVVVFGAGPIGLAAVALLRASGAAKIYCFETKAERRKLAIDNGADLAFDPIELSENGKDQGDLLMELTHGRGIALFAECSGATRAVYPVMAKSLAIGAKTIQIGHTMGLTPVDMYSWQFNACTISGSNGQSGLGIYSDVISLMAAGRIDPRKMVTGRVNLEDILVGMDQADNRTSGKILVSTEYPRTL